MFAAVLATAGCAPTAASRPTATAPAAVAPVIRSSPAPSSDAALDRFDRTVRAVLVSTPKAGGKAITEALIAAGFARKGMQVTPDRTSVGLAVPSVQFAVLVRSDCIIGQTGPAAGAYSSEIAAPIDGTCLLGTTRPITW